MAKSKLTSIADLKGMQRGLLKEVTVVNRIEALLEDMNLAPAKLCAEFGMGDATRRTHIFHASMVGSLSGNSLDGKYPMGCGRQLYYSYTNAESEGAWEPRMRRVLDTGSALHAQLQAYLHEVAKRSNGNERFEDEVDVDPEINEIADQLDLSGHLDGIYKILKPTPIRFGIEIKTINDNGYKNTRGPHGEHIMQGTIYQACMDLPVMLFIYYNKNDSSLAEYVQVFDPHRWEAIKEKILLLKQKAITKELPDQEVTFACNNCRYKGLCKPPKRMRGAAVQQLFRTKSRED